MGLGETGWYVGLQEGARLRPSGQNQGQAQLTLARQPGLDKDHGQAQTRLLCGWVCCSSTKSDSMGRGLSG